MLVTIICLLLVNEREGKMAKEHDEEGICSGVPPFWKGGGSSGGRFPTQGERRWGASSERGTRLGEHNPVPCRGTSRGASPHPSPRRGAALGWQPVGAGFSFRKAARGGLSSLDASIQNASSTRARLCPHCPEMQREEQAAGGPVPRFEPLT